jgi:hypothetical protein
MFAPTYPKLQSPIRKAPWRVIIARFSSANLRFSLQSKGLPLLYDQRARYVVALARNLDFLGSRVLTGLTAVFVASLH